MTLTPAASDAPSVPSGGTGVNRSVDERAVPRIEDSVTPGEQPRDFLERYYECRYLLDCREAGHDYRLLFHSNGLIVVMLAPSHPLTTTGTDVTGIDFQVTEHTNRLENRVQGKGKRGAQVVTAEAPLSRVTCADGAQYVIPACARGKLIQLNEKLRSQPQLLTTHSGGEGFVAIILPKLGASSGQKAGTVDCAEYARRRAASAPAAGQDSAGSAACSERDC
ncbi:protein Abitram-like [Pollicipes pollicipes]|uniref:protein Abitram-like n=1 Tax=Pollicipes pollicipes TaxID=41117 RepID=UPI0018852966|nr:protein Abitram-like [Pollicipes pollicipes]XP_037070486.1 protein Abitram-like [Pollicipes pollicipes]XP_037070487.1 protein Abitram-like [Pollicipes pollicipes]XP_037070488.1 protein Abitram-like [Pollicipes pollicipes]XP_037070489.1 protein Abitram-like [Pollicipes pollicipes]XP_037070490.1 protein Abitram-like [Pollicipes pollicipes]XP_037070492.1 protein Abitram-like [Pollicipes pollicipes]XP_037070493.1 protein Abitram-like [Pollicipes pollicipes]XP_037070494.1 protein Abitram-like